MDQLLFWLIFAPIFGFAMYQMYRHGFAVSKSIVDLDAGGKYFLRWEFSGTTGECELRW